MRGMTVRRTLIAGAAVAAAVVVAGCAGEPARTDGPATAQSVTTTSPETSAPPSPAGPAPSGPTSPDRSTPAAEQLPPPYVESAVWVQTQVGPSLQISPTGNGRRTAGPGDADVAWSEVLALAPDADTPGMRAQFDCHWTFARIVDPEKPSWNIEPGRPVVTDAEMIRSRCNPGFAEE